MNARNIENFAPNASRHAEHNRTHGADTRKQEREVDPYMGSLGSKIS